VLRPDRLRERLHDSVGSLKAREIWSVVDGAGLVHAIVFPGRSALAYLTLCDRTFGGDEVQRGDQVRTCLQCLAKEER
jgi:hypothetical protein